MQHLPKAEHDALREYFFQRRHMNRTVRQKDLLLDMSPTMQGRVAVHLHREWLPEVRWISGGSAGFIASIALAFELACYAQQEVIAGDQFHVVNRGVVVRGFKVLSSGMVWGIDAILTSDRLRDLSPARALTFVEVSGVTRPLAPSTTLRLTSAFSCSYMYVFLA